MITITKLEDCCRRCASCKSEENLWNLNIFPANTNSNIVTVLCQDCLRNLRDEYNDVFHEGPLYDD